MATSLQVGVAQSTHEVAAPSGLTCKQMLAYRAGAWADVFKALADPTRRAILDELTERDGQTLFELCARLTTRHGLAGPPGKPSRSTSTCWKRPG